VWRNITVENKKPLAGKKSNPKKKKTCNRHPPSKQPRLAPGQSRVGHGGSPLLQMGSVHRAEEEKNGVGGKKGGLGNIGKKGFQVI